MLGKIGQIMAETIFKILCRVVMIVILGFIFFLLASLPTPFSQVSVVGDEDPELPPIAPPTVAATVR